MQLAEPHHTGITPIQSIEYEHGPLVVKAADDLPDGTSEILGIDFFLHRRCLFICYKGNQ
jgi:hypothetical protein